VLRALYERLTVVQERDSRIISVLVRSSNPKLAADIANAIAEAHVARRAGLSLSDTAEASGWLAEEIAKLRVRVTDAETAVATFKVNNDLFSGANNTSLLDQQLSTIATQINAAQERKNTALSRATLIRDMIAKGQPIDGVADVRDSVVIQQLSQEKARLQGEKAQRSATLLANHPTIRALTAQIAELNNQINLEGRRVADALEAESRIEADLETSLQADLARAKTSASTATQDTVTLEGLQREAKAQRDLLESYLQRYSEATSRTDSNSTLPDVRVVTQAVPAASPASPKTTLILLAVGLGALMVQLGLVVFGELISGRVIIAPPEVEPLRERPQDELDEPPFISDAATELEEEPVEDEPAEAALEDVRDAVMAEMDAMRLQPAASAATRENIRELMKSLRRNRDSAPEPVLEAPPLTILTGEKLAADLVLGKTHLLLLAAHGAHADCEALAEELVHAAIGRGLSVALIDAGSGRIGAETGLTDLSADAASFGDVVHKSADNSFAEVVWGQGQSIAPSSSKPFTLVEALGDIYEVVVVMTGRVGRMSSLPVFKGLDGRLVLVAGNTDEPEAVSATRARLRDAGYADCDIVAAPEYAAA
uniref:GumC family protein n=1 Tax=Devosia sp. TaxID=1871048 RepID=UPI002AFE5A40